MYWFHPGAADNAGASPPRFFDYTALVEELFALVEVFTDAEGAFLEHPFERAFFTKMVLTLQGESAFVPIAHGLAHAALGAVVLDAFRGIEPVGEAVLVHGLADLLQFLLVEFLVLPFTDPVHSIDTQIVKPLPAPLITPQLTLVHSLRERPLHLSIRQSRPLVQLTSRFRLLLHLNHCSLVIAHVRQTIPVLLQ